MPDIRIKDAATLLGVSDDTVRRWIAGGRLTASDEGGVRTVDGAELAAIAHERARPPAGNEATRTSARNRFTGLVTEVVADTVMAQVTLQCGPFEVTSLMSAEAARELELAPGVVASAVIKATTVIVEREKGSR